VGGERLCQCGTSDRSVTAWSIALCVELGLAGSLFHRSGSFLPSARCQRARGILGSRATPRPVRGKPRASRSLCQKGCPAGTVPCALGDGSNGVSALLINPRVFSHRGSQQRCGRFGIKGRKGILQLAVSPGSAWSSRERGCRPP